MKISPSLRASLQPLLVGLALSILVLAPLTHGGWVWLLDTVSGPHPKFGRMFYGLDGGVFQFLSLALAALNRIFGPRIAAVIPFVITFPLAALGMWRVIPGSRVAKLGAALFYCLAPVIFDRVWVGHSGYLVGYAVMPFVFSSLRSAFDGERRGWVRVAGWIALSTAASPHFIWICIVLLISVLLTRRPSKQIFAGAALAVMLAGLCSAYLLPNSKDTGRTFTVDQRDVAAFASRSIGHEPLVYSVATMRGFWRIDQGQPLNNFPGRPVILVVGLLVIIVGLTRGEKSQRSLARSLLVASVLATLLALGDRGPTGSVFLWCFHHLPGFAIMREPLKFVALNALFGAFAFGLGVDRLRSANPSRKALVVPVVVAIVVPLSLSPGIFWGYGNRLKAVKYPAAWDHANQVMGSGDGSVLALPWHQYETFPFLHERIIVNPASTIFQRQVLQGDNVELPGLPTAWATTNSEYLSYLYDHHSDITTFGALVAPLNVKYIALTKTVDFSNYEWLSTQRDLKVVYENADIAIYENTKWFGSQYEVRNPVTVSDWGELAGYSNIHDDVRGVFTNNIGPGVVRDPTTDHTPNVSDGISKRKSHTAYGIRTKDADAIAVLSENYVTGWGAKHANVTQSPEGGIAVSAPKQNTTLVFHPWARYITAYAISIVSALVVLCLSLRVRNKSKDAPSVDAKQ